MRITESRLRRIIRSVIRESQEDIYRRFPSEENIVDYTDEENFPEVDEYEFPDEYVDYGEVRSGPFGMTPEEREELYRSRKLPRRSHDVYVPAGPISPRQKEMMKNRR